MGMASSPSQSFEFVKASRETLDVLDIAKVCDVLLFAMTCRNVDLSNWKKDPDVFAHAIDERGYEILQVLRGQGLPVPIGVLLDLEQVKEKKRGEVKKLFHRYFTSEFSEKDKFHSLEDEQDTRLLMRSIEVAYHKEFFW